jgi:hypothetical protein
MINLLPPSERKALRREYRIRVAVIFLASILCVEVVLIAMFVPAAYALRMSTDDLRLRITETKNSTPANVASVEGQILDLRKSIDLLVGGENIVITQYIDAIARAKPDGVSVTGISLDKLVSQPSKSKTDVGSNAATSTILIVLKGYASTRDDLTTFRSNLRKETAHFSGAEFDAKYLLREPIEFSNMRLILKP